MEQAADDSGGAGKRFRNVTSLFRQYLWPREGRLRRRLGEFDPVDDLCLSCPPLVMQTAIGIICFFAALLTREFVDLFATGAGPFSLIYPAIMLSTLYGRWQAGLLTFLLAFFHAWYFVLPEVWSFHFDNPADLSRTIVNGTAALVILFFAEAFRAAVRRATRERDQELKTQVDLMRELEHRTKNNFSMVAGLLSLQQRTARSDEARDALLAAASRVRSFAALHESIYLSDRYTQEISLRDYLAPLVRQVHAGLFDGRQVDLDLYCDPDRVPRDRAVALGLVVIEALTNAAKHGFSDGRPGRVAVAYRRAAGGRWELTIADNGMGTTGGGEPSGTRAFGGLGSQLLEAFAITAGGVLSIERDASGTCVRLTEDRGETGRARAG